MKVASQKFPYSLRLIFQQRCPKPSEIRKLHPSIKLVNVPPRPKGGRVCTIKTRTAEAADEICAALHKKSVQNYKGTLRCVRTDLKKYTYAGEEDKPLKVLDVKHIRLLGSKPVQTEDVKCNSTARELWVRYSVVSLDHEETLRLINTHPSLEVESKDSDNYNEIFYTDTTPSMGVSI